MATGTPTRSPVESSAGYEAVDTGKGLGWITFAGAMVGMLGVLNVIYGIAAIGKSNFFVANAHYVISDLKTWGWITLGVGVVQLFAAGSIWAGGAFGRWVGVGIAAISAVVAMLSIPAYPFWSLAIFTVDILVMYGLITYGGRRDLTA